MCAPCQTAPLPVNTQIPADQNRVQMLIRAALQKEFNLREKNMCVCIKLAPHNTEAKCLNQGENEVKVFAD